MIKYSRKGSGHREVFLFENGLIKIFRCDSKKQHRRARKFSKKYTTLNTWFDNNIQELKELK